MELASRALGVLNKEGRFAITGASDTIEGPVAHLLSPLPVDPDGEESGTVVVSASKIEGFAVG